MGTIIKKLSVAMCFVFIMGSLLHAVNLSFSDTNFTTSGKGSIRTAYVINASDKLIPIKISVTNWRLDEEGNNINKDTKDFIIEPRQLILKPKEKQVVSIRYIGDVDIEREKVYQVLAAELPVKEPKKRGNFRLRMVQNMIQTVYVNQPEFKHDITLEKVELIQKEVPFDDKEGVRQIENRQFFKLTFENSGEKRYVNKGLKVILYPRPAKADREVEIEVLRMPLILGESKRVKYIEWPEKMNAKKWKGEIKSLK